MELVTKFFESYFKLIQITSGNVPFMYLIGAFFVSVLVINITCYIFWGRY